LEEGKAVVGRLAQLIDRPPADEEAQGLIGDHYEHICTFFDCSLAVFSNLGRMYVEDDRFAAYFRKFRTDLPAFMRDAIAVYRDRMETRE